MYDLNQAVRQWRQTMSQGGAQSVENLQELESHLRDEITSLQKSGLSEEESFLVAARRLGSPGALAVESSKTDPFGLWRYRIYWMAGGVLLYLCLQWARGTFTALSAIVLRTTGLGVTGQGIGLIAAHAGFIVALAALLVRFYRNGVPLHAKFRWPSSVGDKVMFILIFCVVAGVAQYLRGYLGLVVRGGAIQGIIQDNRVWLVWYAGISSFFTIAIPLLTIILLVAKHEWSRPEALWEQT